MEEKDARPMDGRVYDKAELSYRGQLTPWVEWPLLLTWKARHEQRIAAFLSNASPSLLAWSLLKLCLALDKRPFDPIRPTFVTVEPFPISHEHRQRAYVLGQADA